MTEVPQLCSEWHTACSKHTMLSEQEQHIYVFRKEDNKVIKHWLLSYHMCQFLPHTWSQNVYVLIPAHKTLESRTGKDWTYKDFNHPREIDNHIIVIITFMTYWIHLKRRAVVLRLCCGYLKTRQSVKQTISQFHPSASLQEPILGNFPAAKPSWAPLSTRAHPEPFSICNKPHLKQGRTTQKLTC